MNNEKYFDYFRRITGYDPQESYDLLGSFLSNELFTFIAFYNGEINILNDSNIRKLEQLKESFDKIVSLIYTNSSFFNNAFWFEFLDNVESIRTQIDSFFEMRRFLRSTAINASNSQFFTENVILNDNQTIESFIKNSNQDDEENRWVDVAQDNLLKEEDYTPFDNIELKIKFRTLIGATDITGTVDSIDSTTVYGKDIKNGIEFVDDDIASLDNLSTFSQSCDILSNLKKNDNFLFKEIGIDRELIVGVNRSSILFLSLFRQMAENFSTDDSIKSFGINSIEIEKDGVFVDYTIESVANDIVNKSVLFTQNV